MRLPRNWTLAGIGIEVIAAVMMAIEPLLAIPVGLGGLAAIVWGIFPNQVRDIISRLLLKTIKAGHMLGLISSDEMSDVAAIQQESEPAEPTPLTWLELEQRFKELEGELLYTHINGQTGAAGDHWLLAGGLPVDAKRQFEAVATIASTRLFRDFPSEIAQYPELELESNPLFRWYKALRFIGGCYKEGHIVKQVNDDGSSGGFIYRGSIQQPAKASATLCLELASRSAEQT